MERIDGTAGEIIGARVRQRRLHSGSSQRALADLSQIDVSHVARIGTGVSNLAVSTLIRVSAALDTTADPLFCR
ncbi:helix-turn-helix domain-containing protein [Microbacterium sp. ASV49]|uniref:Helix-turn-helix transcriptional regulator n=1 Tax=Microbacterium candidum TaxID=3041922 RepID=A0ABT7N205_9MICO|nr:helix-turn-helix transcriptional regulator [Microbacterium sp. ASV49]MDL9980738.1 helix-turn-helix transcriptional regulator [Microbacterium sp. ASV49]